MSKSIDRFLYDRDLRHERVKRINDFKIYDFFYDFRRNKVNHSLKFAKETMEAVVQRCNVRKVFLKISQNSQENTCVRERYQKRDSGTGTFL